MKKHLGIIAGALLTGMTLVPSIAADQNYEKLHIGDKMPTYSETLHVCGEREEYRNKFNLSNGSFGTLAPKDKELVREYCNDKEELIEYRYFPINKAGEIRKEFTTRTVISKTPGGERILYSDGGIGELDGRIDVIITEHKKIKKNTI